MCAENYTAQGHLRCAFTLAHLRRQGLEFDHFDLKKTNKIKTIIKKQQQQNAIYSPPLPIFFSTKLLLKWQKVTANKNKK